MAETQTKDQEGGAAQSSDAEHAHHPSVGEYVEIGVILAVLTGIEVALFYAPLTANVTVPALIALTFAKFALVVMWFMHLRFDSKIFRRLLMSGMLLAAAIFAVAVVLVL
jgi:cytochrome c oxidase subunit IV